MFGSCHAWAGGNSQASNKSSVEARTKLLSIFILASPKLGLDCRNDRVEERLRAMTRQLLPVRSACSVSLAKKIARMNYDARLGLHQTVLRSSAHPLAIFNMRVG